MEKVIIKILGKDGETEEVKYITIENLAKMYPLEGTGEAEICDALDILSENCPGLFANSEGKVSYDFEIAEM